MSEPDNNFSVQRESPEATFSGSYTQRTLSNDVQSTLLDPAKQKEVSRPFENPDDVILHFDTNEEMRKELVGARGHDSTVPLKGKKSTHAVHN